MPDHTYHVTPPDHLIEHYTPPLSPLNMQMPMIAFGLALISILSYALIALLIRVMLAAATRAARNWKKFLVSKNAGALTKFVELTITCVLLKATVFRARESKWVHQSAELPVAELHNVPVQEVSSTLHSHAARQVIAVIRQFTYNMESHKAITIERTISNYSVIAQLPRSPATSSYPLRCQPLASCEAVDPAIFAPQFCAEQTSTSSGDAARLARGKPRDCKHDNPALLRVAGGA